MGGLSIWHWLIVLVVVLLVFGTGRVSSLMGELGKGIKTFRQNVTEDEDGKPKDASMTASLDAPQPAQPAPAPKVDQQTHVG
jgi:sec-independent protein translocase protein TatA